MARPIGVAGTEKLEFFQKFDALARDHVDPLKLMFQIANGDKSLGKGWEKMHRLIAARELLGYRYPKLKAVEMIVDNEDKQWAFTWVQDAIDSDSLQAAPLPIAPASGSDPLPGDCLPQAFWENGGRSE